MNLAIIHCFSVIFSPMRRRFFTIAFLFVCLNLAIAGFAPGKAWAACTGIEWNNGHSDWYLPAKNELLVLDANNAILGVPAGTTWSSSDNSATDAWYIGITLALENTGSKEITRKVRCTRKN